LNRGAETDEFLQALAEEDPTALEYAEATASAAPEFDPTWHWIWRAWEALSDGRDHLTTGITAPMGGSIITSMPRPITWLALQRWVEARFIGEDDAEMMSNCIRQMDVVFLAWWRKQNQPAAAAPNA